MTKLTRYTNFEDLKSDAKSDETASIKNNKVLLEFEAFLNLLHDKFSVKKKTKNANGKQYR